MSDITLRAQEYTAQKEAEEAAKPKGFDHDRLLRALYWAWDVFDRANVEFFGVKQTGREILYDQLLSGDHLDIGIRRLEWTSGGKRIIDDFSRDNLVKEDETKAEYIYEGVPVILWVYDDNPCLASLNTVMYFNEAFKLPNPFDLFEKEYDK